MAKFTAVSYNGEIVAKGMEGKIDINGNVAIIYRYLPTNENAVAVFNLKKVFILKDD